MKIFIEVDVPLEQIIKSSKGDRSLRSLASDTGTTHFNISRILNGRQGTTLETLRLLGSALDIDVDQYVREALRDVGL